MPKLVNALIWSSPMPQTPDDAILWIHSVVPEPVLVFAEFFCDASDVEDGLNLVDVHGHAAGAKDLDAGDVQFRGSNSCRRFRGMSAVRAKTSATQAFGSCR